MMLTLLDGSMGQELVNRYDKPATGLWSTAVMIDRPDLVEAVHRDYFDAGALIATTNTYGILRDRLTRHDLEDRFAALHVQALELASRARDKNDGGYIAGSLGPTGWSYRPDLAPRAEEAAEIYAEIARIHAPFVDLLICETMASIDMALGAVMGAAVAGKPVWMALTVDDKDGTRLRSGEPVADVAPALADHGVDAFLANCALPEAINDTIPLLAEDRPRGAYANGFTEIKTEFARPDASVAALDSRTDLDPPAYAAFAEHWLADGATIVGGCCEIGPAHIAHLRAHLEAAGHEFSTDLPGIG